jgi:hypothetical protein
VSAPENPDSIQSPSRQPDDTVTVEAAPPFGAGPTFGNGYHVGMAALTAVGFLSGVVLLWFFGYTFWVVLEGIRRALGGSTGESLFLSVLNQIAPLFAGLFGGRGWTLDAAIAYGVAAAWAAIYLYFDRLAMYRNRAAQETLLQKARAASDPISPVCYFVEVRRTRVDLPLPPDTGWLLFYPDRLVFIGDEYRATFPCIQVRDNVAIRRSIGGLGANWVELELAPPYGLLRFLPRQNATRLSDTIQNVGPLYEALTAWLSETQPAVSAER